MSSPSPLILTINGGSSSIKFSLYRAGAPPELLLSGQVERIGRPGTALSAKGVDGLNVRDLPLEAGGLAETAEKLIHWLDGQFDRRSLIGIGHRVVHGGVRFASHQLVTPELLAELRRTAPLDLAHLPQEITLIESFAQTLPDVPQVACFDTAFHHDLPRVAQLLPIPRRYLDAGVRRFGFHGLSYSYLMDELERIAGAEAARGRIILAHLGSGASLAAVRDRAPVDTTMGFTPTSGLVMGTRPGDLDPGLLTYLMRTEQKSPEQMDQLLNTECGLLGVSGTSNDMRDLLARRSTDPRAAEAVDLFCYQARKWVGAFTAALSGLDTLVFSAGIGEHGPEVRAGICSGLEYLGLRLDEARNAKNDPIISAEGSTVTVRVIPTNEELVIAQAVGRIVESRPSKSQTV